MWICFTKGNSSVLQLLSTSIELPSPMTIAVYGWPLFFVSLFSFPLFSKYILDCGTVLPWSGKIVSPLFRLWLCGLNEPYGAWCALFWTHWGRDKMVAIRRRNFQMNFLEWKCMNIESNFTEVFPQGPINNIPALVQITAWCLPGDKPFSGPIIVTLPEHRVDASLGLNDLKRPLN